MEELLVASSRVIGSPLQATLIFEVTTSSPNQCLLTLIAEKLVKTIKIATTLPTTDSDPFAFSRSGLVFLLNPKIPTVPFVALFPLVSSLKQNL